jgi:peptidoglycan DL-endopeptidase CwlO
MRSGSRWALVLALAVAVSLPTMLAVVPAHAKPTLAQRKAAQRQKAQRIRAQLEVLDRRLERTIERFNLANIELDAVQKRVDKATRQLKVARYKLLIARDTLKDRAVAMYKQRPVDILDVVFSSRSLVDLVSELRNVREIGSNDSRIVDDIERLQAQIEKKRKGLVADRAKARKLVASVRAKKATIEGTLYQRQQMLSGVEQEIKKIEAAERRAAEAAARAAAAAAAAYSNYSSWRSPRAPVGDAGPGHPEVIAIARRYLGIPYVYAAADPAVGFDCSGLVMYCYAQIGIMLPHYSGFQQNMGKPVAMTALIPGDLVFKGYPVSYHVGLYAGAGMVIEAPHTGDVVKYDTVADFQYAVRL